MTNGRALQLAAIAALIKDRELAALGELTAKRRREEDAARALLDARARNLSGACPDPAHLCGADGAWLRLNIQKVRDQGVRTALAAASVEDQIARARRAFGRAQALERIARNET